MVLRVLFQRGSPKQMPRTYFVCCIGYILFCAHFWVFSSIFRFNNLVTEMGVPHVVLADLETILFSGRAAPLHPQFFPKDFEPPQLLKPLPYLPLKQPQQTEDPKKQKKQPTDVSPRKPAKPTSPQKSRKTSPQKSRPPSPPPANTSPQKPRQKSPQKRTTVSRAERNRSNSPPEAKTRKIDSPPPPTSKARKVDSSPPKTRGKEVSPQKPKQKPGAGKLSKQESVYEYDEDSPPNKKRRYGFF
jgi:hypothetical protein